MKRNKLVFLVFALTLSGCLLQAKPAKWKGLIPTLEAGQGRIYFYRAASKKGFGIKPIVMLNGEAVGKSMAGEFFIADRPPGVYEAVLSTRLNDKLSLELGEGEERHVRMAVEAGKILYKVRLEPVSPATALQEMKPLRFNNKRRH